MNTVQETKYFILKLESYDGDDTFLNCGDTSQDFLYCIVVLTKEDALEIVDNGYRSVREALAAWPDAQPIQT